MNRTFKILLLLLLPAFSGSLSAQRLAVYVKDMQRNPLPGATVRLLKVADSTEVFSITDSDGIARFGAIEHTLYQLNISYVGYKALERSISVKSDQARFNFELEEDVINLSEVAIVAMRPLIRQEDDKMIIDPEPIANISTNTLEVLEKTPGIFVDQDGGIFLSSTSPAKVYINGREQKMSNQDITNLLRSLPPGSVQRIEVMRTPSTRYDASSSGGIVNIVLKKGVRIGRFGSVNAGMNQGAYGNRFGGFSLNNSGERHTSYLNMNYNRNAFLEELYADRLLSNEQTLTQDAETVQKSDQVYTGFGINYELNPRLDFSYDGRINASLRRSDAVTENTIRTFESLLSENRNEISNESTFFNMQHDLGLIYRFDTLGSEWDNKFGYAYTGNTSFQEYETTSLFPFDARWGGEGDNLQSRHFWLLQSDLTKVFANRIKLETGFKGTVQLYGSEADYLIKLNGQSVNDPFRTGSYEYREMINAAYAQMSVPMPAKFLLKTGLRYEQTFMKGNQRVPVDTSFTVNRGDLFPYVFLSRPLFEIAGYELRAFMIYRKTISRPDYQSLNPYVKYIDQYLYEVGNPSLKPQFTHNIEANVSFDQWPVLAIGRNYTTDIFSAVVYPDEEFENVAVRTFDNVGRNRETYFRGFAGIPPIRKYFFMVGAQYNHNEYEGIYENQPFTFNRGSWRFFTFHSLTLGSNTRLTMFGFMMQKGQMNFYELESFGQLNFGLNRTFLDKKLVVSLSARDVLRTSATNFTLNQGSVNLSGSRYMDNQRFGLNVRYNFGIRKKEERQPMMPFEMGEPNGG